MASGDGHRHANKTGKWLEDEVEKTITDYGFSVLHHRDIKTKFGKNIIKDSPKGFLLKNVPYTNMYGEKSTGEFVLQLSNYGPIRIECRNQNVRGSVDEKFPYLIGNCYSFDEKDVVLVVEGSGARSAAKKFVINASKAIAYKKVRVFTLAQFKSWAKRMLSSIES